MENIILKIVALICITVVAAITAFQDEPDYAIGIIIGGLLVVFIPWDKFINLLIELLQI